VGLRTPRTCWLPPIASVSVPCSIARGSHSTRSIQHPPAARVIEVGQLRPELYCHCPAVSKGHLPCPRVSFGSRPLCTPCLKSCQPTLLRRGLCLTPMSRSAATQEDTGARRGWRVEPSDGVSPISLTRPQPIAEGSAATADPNPPMREQQSRVSAWINFARNSRATRRP